MNYELPTGGAWLRRVCFVAATVLATAANAAEPPGHGQHQHGPQHHPQGNPALMAFHELMEPLWHSPAGRATNERACTVADEIVSRARSTAVRPTPEHAQLVASARTLKAACAAGPGDPVGAELDRLHRIFHGLAGMKH